MGSCKCNLLKTLTRSYLQERNQGISTKCNDSPGIWKRYVKEVSTADRDTASAAICWTIHHILREIALWSIYVKKKSDIGVSYSKMGGVSLMRPVKVASKMLYIWNHCSLSFHSSSDACATSGLPCSDLIVLPSSPWILEEKRDYSQSTR